MISLSTTFSTDIYLRLFEPNPNELERDLQNLAQYLIKIGTDLTFAVEKQYRLHQHGLNPILILRLIKKYNLEVKKHVQIDNEHLHRSLYHIAHNYPQPFIQQAALSSPGGYEDRRFWWCANNYTYYLENSRAQGSNDSYQNSPSRLLSDVLCQILSPRERKLIAISALHLSVKHSNPQVFACWFERNRMLIMDQIKRNSSCDKIKAEERRRLRKMFRIEEAETELNPIYVEDFIEWWNLTGLRR